MQIRLCRTCKCELPKERYFHCLVCNPVLSSIDDNFIYEAPDFDEHLENMLDD